MVAFRTCSCRNFLYCCHYAVSSFQSPTRELENLYVLVRLGGIDGHSCARSKGLLNFPGGLCWSPAGSEGLTVPPLQTFPFLQIALFNQSYLQQQGDHRGSTACCWPEGHHPTPDCWWRHCKCCGTVEALISLMVK